MAADGSRPELTVREGERVPVGLPDGDCIVTRLEDGRLRIDHADPRVLISAELVDDVADHPHPDALLDLTGCRTYMGALLKVRGVNRQVVYRLVDWVPSIRAFIGEWPA